MGEKLSAERLSDLNSFISSLMGLHFTESRLGDLERGIRFAAKDFGFDNEAVFVDWLKSRPLTKEHIERLASHLTVGETYFFRDSCTFAVLEKKILPELISARKESKRIRIWSAGCSTGEEAYSVAIVLKRLIPDVQNWNIGIVATDINPRSLKKASDGIYTEWSFRETPDWMRDLYFKRVREGAWRIDSEIQKIVSFGYLNLAEDIYPSLLNNTNGVDIIFCRNVIMYFSDQVARSVVKGLSNSLVDDGWLLVSPAEAVRSVSGLFAPVNIEGAIFYRKTGRAREEEKWHFPESAPGARLFEQAAAEKPPVAPEPVAAPQAPPAQASVERDFTAEASALYGQGRYHEAAKLLESLADKAMGEPEMLLLAKVYANMGSLEEASKWCESVQASNTLNGAAYILLATVRLEQARVEEAIKNLKKVIYIDQDFVIAHFMLGKLLLVRSEGDVQARRHLNTAYALLEQKKDDEMLPESDGLMAGRLREIIASMLRVGSDV